MKQGILIYALNNEQIDYVEIAYNAALRAKKHLNLPVAIVTDSADWLYQKFPNHREVFDMVIRIVNESHVEKWQSNKHYGIGTLVNYNGTIWRKIKEGNEVVNIFNKEFKHKSKFINKNFTQVYIGIEVDKWYPNLPYLVGQHVWYGNTLYRCNTDYEEQDNFSIENYDIIIKKVLDYDVEPDYVIGDIVLQNRTLWQAIVNKLAKTLENEDIIPFVFNDNDFEAVYIGIDIDKWYPNLPYLVGQHVWHENILYRCNTDYEEQDNFSIENYDVLLKNVFDSDLNPSYKSGDIILHNRTLWLSKFDISKDKEVIPMSFEHDINNFDRVYEGIVVDKWYPNLPYLKGQHVWYKNKIYRCEVGYTEEDNFSADRFTILLENVCDLESIYDYNKGDLFLYNRVLWQANTNYGFDNELVSVWYNMQDFDRIYQGIDIDKWYPNLPYLSGQHVWYNNILYRCNKNYQEKDQFSSEYYDILVENVLDLVTLEKFNIGTIVLHDRVLWMSKVNYDSTINEDKIRDDIWEDTKERHMVYNPGSQYRRYFDGSLSNKRLKFKNDIRIKSYELSPFDETLVIDCDYFINNNSLKYCWQQPHDFLIFKEAVDLSGYRYDPRLKTLSDKSIDFYWATVFFFRKNKNTETFFNYLGHIQDNWNYYRYVYQIQNSTYRNDFSFSIGIHVMNGFQKGMWAYSLPGKLYYTTDRDLLIEYNEGKMKFLLEKENYKGEYTIIKTENLNIHVMNKFSLARIFKETSYV